MTDTSSFVVNSDLSWFKIGGMFANRSDVPARVHPSSCIRDTRFTGDVP